MEDIKDMAPVSSLDELHELFYVAAYGCHRQCETEIRRVFYDHGKDNTLFLFFEWFLSQPLPKKSALALPTVNWGGKWEEEVYILAPFAPRLAEHSVVVPVRESADPKPRLRFRDVDAFRNLKLRFRWDTSRNTRDAWECWGGNKSILEGRAEAAPEDLTKGQIRDWLDLRDGKTGIIYNAGRIDEWSWDWQEKYAQEQTEPITKDSLAKLLLLYKPLFVDNGEKFVKGLFVPIASSRLFYGGIWVMFPGLPKTSVEAVAGESIEARSGESDQFMRTVGVRMAEVVSRNYLPVLTVLHESWLELLHDLWLKTDVWPKENTGKLMDDKRNPKGIPAPVDCVFQVRLTPMVDPAASPSPGATGTPAKPSPALFRNTFFPALPLEAKQDGADDADAIESLMNELWSRRDRAKWKPRNTTLVDRLLGGGPGQDREYTIAFKDSLIFKNYLICSDSMIRLLVKVIIASKTLTKPPGSEPLPACLVVGGAGSGKEQLAKMLRLFSVGNYYQGDDYVVNMAAIRPAPLTAAAIAGLEFKAPPYRDFKLKGVLQRIVEEARRSGKPPTIRFDEFNSMDPDSQGVLLRFLDNSEIIPIGGLKDDGKDKPDCLVVGIMNEDPDEISREGAMEFFKNSKYLGNFLGDLLYEQFFRLRRLRPDIMYRMKRNGKFVIPPLRERKQDIPLLFYVFVRNELKARGHTNNGKVKEAHLSLEVLDRLMREDLSWPGNIRQLQALAKLVSEQFMAEANHFVVTRRMIEGPLRDVGLIPNQSKDGGF